MIDNKNNNVVIILATMLRSHWCCEVIAATWALGALRLVTSSRKRKASTSGGALVDGTRAS